MYLYESELLKVECPATVERAFRVAKEAKKSLYIVTCAEYVFVNMSGGDFVNVLPTCPCGNFTHPVRKCVCSAEAMERHWCRYAGRPGVWVNGIITWGCFKWSEKVPVSGVGLLKDSYKNKGLKALDVVTIIETAQAIADMEVVDLKSPHIAEAVAYRSKFAYPG